MIDQFSFFELKVKLLKMIFVSTEEKLFHFHKMKINVFYWKIFLSFIKIVLLTRKLLQRTFCQEENFNQF